MADLAGVVKPSLNPSGFLFPPTQSPSSLCLGTSYLHLFTSTHARIFLLPVGFFGSPRFGNRHYEYNTNTTTEDSIGTDGMCIYLSSTVSSFFFLFLFLLLLLCSKLVRVLRGQSKCGSLAPPCNHQSPFFLSFFFGLRSGGLLLLQHVLMVP